MNYKHVKAAGYIKKWNNNMEVRYTPYFIVGHWWMPKWLCSTYYLYRGFYSPQYIYWDTHVHDKLEAKTEDEAQELVLDYMHRINKGFEKEYLSHIVGQQKIQYVPKK